MILKYRRAAESMGIVYTLQDLTSLEWKGDKNMAAFLHLWIRITYKTVVKNMEASATKPWGIFSLFSSGRASPSKRT